MRVPHLMMFILQGKFSVACFVHCLVLLSNNHQSSGMFYPNITLPQIGPNISTEPQSHPTTIFPDLEKKLLQNCQIVIGGEFDIFDDRFHCFV